jgi:alkylation response protein AidB-like acyl-CoA dehydrogenase
LPEASRSAEDYGARVATVAGTRPAPVDGRAVWTALGHKGLIREVYGEAGAPDPARLAALLGALDTACPTGPTLATCVQVATVIPVLRDHRAGALAGQVADAMMAGEAATSLAATDAGAAGSDLTALTTTVEIGDDTVIVTGAKRWITGACFADHHLVLARHRPGPHFTNFTWVLVPAGAPGVTVEAADTPFFAGAGLGHVSFQEVRLRREHLVGGIGRGLAGFTRHVGAERLAGALWSAAVTRRVLADTKRFLVARGPLWMNEAVRARFARCLVEQRSLAALCADAARRDDLDLGESMLLKAAAARTADYVLTECAHLRGADGFATGGPQWLRAELAMFGIAGGTTDVMLAGLADRADAILDAGAARSPTGAIR